MYIHVSSYVIAKVLSRVHGTVYMIQSLLVGLMSIIITIIQFLRVRGNSS